MRKGASGQTVNTARSADSHLTVIRKGHSHNANVPVRAFVCGFMYVEMGTDFQGEGKG